MSIRQVKNGWKAEERVGGRDSKRISKTFRLKSQAQQWSINFKATKNEGKTIAHTKMTVRAYLEHWHTNIIPTSDRDVSDYTYQRIKNHLDNINSAIGHIKLRELKLLDVIGNDKSTPKIKGLRQIALEKLSDQTVINMESCLKGAIDDGIARKFLSENPMYKYRRHKKAITDDDDDKDVKFFCPQEQTTLLRTALDYSNGIRTRNFTEKRPKDMRWFMRIFLGLATGLRSGEISALTWKKINLYDGTLKVNRSVEYSKGDTKGELKLPKTEKSIRTIKLDKPTIQQLQSYKTWVGEQLLKIGKRLSDYPTLPVIFSDDLGLVHRSQIRKRYDTILKQAKLEHRGYHCLRHSHGSNLICDGYPMELASKRLGHSSIQITMDLYFHIYEEYQNRVDDNILEKVAEKRHGSVTTIQ